MLDTNLYFVFKFQIFRVKKTTKKCLKHLKIKFQSSTYLSLNKSDMNILGNDFDDDQYVTKSNENFSNADFENEILQFTDLQEKTNDYETISFSSELASKETIFETCLDGKYDEIIVNDQLLDDFVIYESIQDSLISKEIQSLSNENNVNFNEMEVIGEFELPQTMNLLNKKILDKNINDNEILLCRLCAQKNENMIYIFQYSPNQQNIAEKINNCLPITVTETDKFSKTICHLCLEKLEFINNFYKTVSEAEANFKKSTDCSETSINEENENNSEEENHPSTKDKTQINDISCRICERKFSTQRKCFLHSTMHTSSNYFPCSLCDINSTTLDEWKKHYTEQHNGRISERMPAKYECKICKKKFITINRLNFHQKFHELNAKACYCDKCDKFLSSESVLYQHSIMVHQQTREFCCDICGIQFRSQSQLATHQRKHNNERPYECKICLKQFNSMDNLRRHEKLHLPTKPFQCNKCDKAFDRINSLNKHLLIHQIAEKSKILCQICNGCKQILFDDSEFHIQNCNEEFPFIEHKQLDTVYRCEFCQQCYTSIESVKNHSTIHSGSCPYVCTICQVTFATYNQIIAHKKAHISKTNQKTIEDKENKVTKLFFCENCEKTFSNFTNMNVHRKTCINNGSTLICPSCDILFVSKQEFTKHKRRREIDEQFNCEKCKISFGNKCGFEIHKTIIHMGNERKNRNLFTCSHCGKAFQQKAHLNNHMRSHTGEKPFACEYCKKKFSFKADRDNHEKIHSLERLFKCKMCEKSFKNSARLREHMIHHSDIRPYKCDYCDQAFKKTNARKVHTLIHTGEKPYQCDICGISFRRTGDLNKHKKTQHKILIEK